MASGWTQKGTYNALDIVFRGATPPTNFYIMLVTDAVTPSKTTQTFSDLANEIASGNGYTSGGYQLDRNATDFDTLTEADPTLIQMLDVVFTASGGPLPSSGDGARWAVLTDDNGTINSREVWAWFDLVSARTISDTQTLTLVDMELNGDLP